MKPVKVFIFSNGIFLLGLWSAFLVSELISLDIDISSLKASILWLLGLGILFTFLLNKSAKGKAKILFLGLIFFFGLFNGFGVYTSNLEPLLVNDGLDLLACLITGASILAPVSFVVVLALVFRYLFKLLIKNMPKTLILVYRSTLLIIVLSLVVKQLFS